MASFYDLFKNPDLEDEKAAFEYARGLTPAERSVMDERQFERQGVKGIERLGRTALGLPESPEDHRALAAAELRALAQKVRPGTVEFYEAAIAILQKHNLPAEAADMEKQRLALETGKAELSPVLKLQRARDVLSKRPDAASPQVQAAIAAIDREMATHGVPKTGGADPEFLKLLDAYEKAVAAGQTERAATIKRALDAKIKAEGGMTPYQKTRLDQIDREFGLKEDKETRKVEKEDEAAVRSVQGVVGIIDGQIQSAEALLDHPGLEWVTGAAAGSAVGQALTPFASNAAANAKALLKNVMAQVFIQALQDLKNASKTTASGLGQLTEREGDKIQNAKTAIDPQQETAQFKTILAEYIRTLHEGRGVAAGELTKAGAPVPAPRPPLLIKKRTAVEIAPGAKPRTAPTPAPEKPKGKWSAKRVE